MFADVEYARRIYDQVVKRNLNAGVSGRPLARARSLFRSFAIPQLRGIR